MAQGHEGIENVGPTSASPFREFICGHCGTRVGGAIIARKATSPSGYWLRCTACGEPSSIDSNENVHPAAPGGVDVEGLPPDVSEAYQEARRCIQVNAFTACELLCRKLLMHVAVDRAGAKAGESFASYIAALEKGGYITPAMKDWVDLIRQHGNEANHLLPHTSRDRAEGTLMFTAEMLRIVYEMAYLAKKYNPPPSP